MHPLRIVVRFHNEGFYTDQNGSVLPAAGLTIDIISGDKTADYPLFAKFIRLLIYSIDIAQRSRCVFRKNINVGLSLINGSITHVVCSFPCRTIDNVFIGAIKLYLTVLYC